MIIPTILEKNLETLEKRLQKTVPFSPVVEVDLADGKLFDGKTYPDLKIIVNSYTRMVAELTKTSAERNHGEQRRSQKPSHTRKNPTPLLDIHLMVKDPFPYLEINAKGIIHKISAHVEAPINMAKWLEEAKQKSYKAGIAIAPKTPLKKLENLVSQADYVQFLTITPGKQGQPFQPQVLETIKTFRKSHPQKEIQVDGGVKKHNIKDVLQAGVNNVVIGSAIVRAENPQEAYEDFVKIEREFHEAQTQI
ncbi:hypothetical protein GF360_00465 [candidate division WWE3 bacterium]|nr:hypothetical protein [candidate division WWE3 bacterium]